MKKKNSYPRLSEEDIDLLKNICVSGGATLDFAADKVGSRRVRRLIELKVLKKNTPYLDDSKKNNVKKLNSVSLDLKGIEICLDRMYCTEIQGFNGYYHTKKTQFVVDDLLNKKNISIEDILNEKEQRVRFKKEIWNANQNNIKYAINDIAYYDEYNKLHSVEIETDYRKGLILRHKNFAEKVLGVKYESHKADLPKRRR